MDILLFLREDIPLKLIMVASRVQKFEIFKKGSSKLFLLCELHYEKTFFFHGGKKRCFFLVFTMNLPSDALSYLNAHSILNFATAFSYF